MQGFVWQMKDRSESGCRLRGKIVNSNRVVPGSLVAFREHHNAPWTLAVVRRLRKRMGDRIDIGVEYIGRNPLVVTSGRRGRSPRFVGRRRTGNASITPRIHLHEGSGHPHLPFRTMILSARQFNAGRRLSLQSDGAEYTVRLQEPIEEQDRFVWLSYELVFRLAADGPTQGRPYAGGLAIAGRAASPPVHRSSGRRCPIADAAGPTARWRGRKDLTLFPRPVRAGGRSVTSRAGGARASGLDHEADALRPAAAIDLLRPLAFLPMVAARRAG